jgi:hypothetical protein
MQMTDSYPPNRCLICGHYLTTSEKYAGERCPNPGHWLATGALSPTDYYQMAYIIAQTSVELKRVKRRFEAQPIKK